MISLQETGYLDTIASLEEKKSLSKGALIEHVHSVDSKDRKQSGSQSLFTMAERQMTEPTWQRTRRLRSGEKSLSPSEIKPSAV